MTVAGGITHPQFPSFVPGVHALGLAGQSEGLCRRLDCIAQPLLIPRAFLSRRQPGAAEEAVVQVVSLMWTDFGGGALGTGTILYGGLVRILALTE